MSLLPHWGHNLGSVYHKPLRGEAFITELSQNYHTLTIATARLKGYRQAYDLHLSCFQMPHSHRASYCSGDEFEAITFGRRFTQFGQGSSFWRLRYSRYFRAFRLAKAMGWVDIFWSRCIRHTYRGRTTDHELRPYWIYRRRDRKSARDSFPSYNNPFRLVSTPGKTEPKLTHRWRYLCAA